jgi:hypothetical protein
MIARQQPVQCLLQILLRPRSGFDHGHTRGGVRNKDIEKSIATGPGYKTPELGGEVEELSG